MITILIPVLGRPERASQVVASIRSNSHSTPEILFLCSPGDGDEFSACCNTGEHTILVDWQPGHGDYARKMNHGFRHSHNDFVLLGADDLVFHKHWDQEVLVVAQQSGAAVVGTNDLGNPAVTRKHQFSTHALVRRSYVKKQGASADGPGVLCHEGYDHNFVDRELWDVAESRGLTAFAPRSRVEHMHPHWGKSVMDATYEKGLAQFFDDQRLYWSRCHLWGKPLKPREQQELNRWERRDARQTGTGRTR